MSIKNQSGFSLIEVLISLVVLLVGLLGIIGMQLAAINNTETARYNGIASIYASDFATRMRGNSGYWGTPPGSVSISNSTITGGPAVSTAVCTQTAGTVCSFSQMAYYDLTQWGATLSAALPAGTATLACNAAVSPAICTLTINWNEKNVALTNPSGTETGVLASGTTSSHNFQTLVSIQP